MRVVALTAMQIRAGLIKVFRLKLGGLAIVTLQTGGRHFLFHKIRKRRRMRAVTIEALARRGRRVGMFGFQGLIYFRMAGETQLAGLGQEQLLVLALMRIVACHAIPLGKGRMDGLGCFRRVGDVRVARGAKLAGGFNLQMRLI